MSTKALLGGFPLLSSSNVRWELNSGVKPFEAEFDMMPDDADKLLAGNLSPVELTLDDDRGRSVTIAGLFVLARSVGENEYIARVLVVDSRWFWSYTHVERQINIRRNVGNKRQKNPDTPPEIDPLIPKIAYAPFSLKDGKPWTAKQVLESVLDQLMKKVKEFGGVAQYQIQKEIGSQLNDLPIEDLNLDDPGDVALRRVLTYLPDAAVTIDKDGKTIIRAKTDGTENQVASELGPESVGLGHVEFISNSRIRPREIHVLFTREHEVRFDFEETDSPTYTEDQRYMDNVLPVPDYELAEKGANGQETGNTLAQGTWITLVSAFNSWQAPPRQPHLSGAAGWLKFTRRAMVPYMDMWTPIGFNGQRDADADWMGRLSAIQTHYRRTFRINHRWMSRILQLKAEKKATIDPATGTRAPALAYADHARVSGMRAERVYFSVGKGDQVPFVINVRSSPDSARANFDYPPAPADVSIVDHDQGIVSIDFRPDIYRLHEMILPSMVESAGSGTDGIGRPLDCGPSANIADTNTAIAWNAIDNPEKVPQLTANHKVALVLTAVPAGTNSEKMQQFQRVKITPSQVTNILPASLQQNIKQSNGPILELRVSPTLETARVAWVTSRSKDIEAAFGIDDRTPKIDDLVVNLKGDKDGGASLQAWAEAFAARTWAALTDRMQGSKTARLSPGTSVSGAIDTVAHEVTTLGAVQTEIRLPGKLDAIDIFSLLPESTRRLALRMIPSPGKVAK